MSYETALSLCPVGRAVKIAARPTFDGNDNADLLVIVRATLMSPRYTRPVCVSVDRNIGKLEYRGNGTYLRNSESTSS